MTADSDLPVIDFGPFLLADAAQQRMEPGDDREFRIQRQTETAQQIREACTRHGFFYATNHGIDPSLIHAVFDQTGALFDLPSAKKSAMSSMNNPLFRGYISTTDGWHTCNSESSEELGVGDQKESFTLGATGRDERVSPKEGEGNSPMHGPNQWPESSELPSFRTTLEAYWEAQIELSRVLARGIALSLDLQADFFEPHLTDPVAQMVLLRYPPPPPASIGDELACQTKHPGCGEHTDCGFLTILAQTHPGLEVKDPHTQQWKAVMPIEGALVVNLGDMAARWTNEAYRSTEHRVNNTTNSVRYSIPFFCNCNFDAPVECIVGSQNQQRQHSNDDSEEEEPEKRQDHDKVAKYEPTTAGVYILEKLGLMRLVK